MQAFDFIYCHARRRIAIVFAAFVLSIKAFSLIFKWTST